MYSIWQQKDGYNHKTEELARTSSYITLKEAVDVSLAAIINGYSPEFVRTTTDPGKDWIKYCTIRSDGLVDPHKLCSGKAPS